MTARKSMRLAPKKLALILAVLMALMGVASPLIGSSGWYDITDVVQGTLATIGLAEPLDQTTQIIVELRLLRTITTIAVGAALALSGALLQGVFRNDLASPSLLGVSSGASLGASVAVLALNGYGPLFLLETSSIYAPFLVCLAALAGALIVTALVTVIATTGGRISVPTLLLVGIAMNAVANGLLFAIQAWFLEDFEVTRALIAWSFGTLNNRVGFHAGLIAAAVLFAAAVLPFVSRELDLFATGEEDAKSLGVNTIRVKILALGAAALAAAVAVAVAGNITFVGLVVPHVLRLLSTRSHRGLLPLCLLGGPVFLLGTDLLQRLVLGDAQFGPGVTMSLIGGPFFLFLLVRNRKAVQAW